MTPFAYLRAFLRTRHNLGLEILALRRQVAVLKRRHPRPRLNSVDRLFWIALRRLWPRWMEALILVKPQTLRPPPRERRRRVRDREAFGA